MQVSTIISIIILAMLLCSFDKKKSVPTTKFNFDSSKALKNIPEPSDIVYDKERNSYYIVSDHGILFECGLTGKIIRKAAEGGLDYEGVEVKDSFVYVSDETPRRVYKYNKYDFSMVKEYQLSYGGPANKAFESITYNYTKNCFILVSQQPVSIFEYDDKFHLIDHYRFTGANEISSARWYKGELYMLSGYDETIYRCDANTYALKEQYKINVYNPEGLGFDNNGNVVITSDRMQKIYFFKNLPTTK